MKRRNFIAMSLRSARFAQRVVRDKRAYDRKRAKRALKREDRE